MMIMIVPPCLLLRPCYVAGIGFCRFSLVRLTLELDSDFVVSLKA